MMLKCGKNICSIIKKTHSKIESIFLYNREAKSCWWWCHLCVCTPIHHTSKKQSKWSFRSLVEDMYSWWFLWNDSPSECNRLSITWILFKVILGVKVEIKEKLIQTVNQSLKQYSKFSQISDCIKRNVTYLQAYCTRIVTSIVKTLMILQRQWHTNITRVAMEVFFLV